MHSFSQACERIDALAPSTIMLALGALFVALAAVEAITRRISR